MKMKLTKTEIEEIEIFNGNSILTTNVIKSDEQCVCSLMLQKITFRNTQDYIKLFGEKEGFTKTLDGFTINYVSADNSCTLIISTRNDRVAKKLPEKLKQHVLDLELRLVMSDDNYVTDTNEVSKEGTYKLATKLFTELKSINKTYTFNTNKELPSKMTEIEFEVAKLIEKHGEERVLDLHHKFTSIFYETKTFQAYVKKVNKVYCITEERLQTDELYDVVGTISGNAQLHKFFA